MNTIGSLFSGIGGLDLGLEWAGLDRSRKRGVWYGYNEAIWRLQRAGKSEEARMLERLGYPE